MRISDAAQHSGVPARLLRYYEDQGLLDPARNSSGYRDYTDDDVAIARRVRQLLDAGLSTATIRGVLPCLADRDGQLAPTCPGLIEDLRREQTRIENAIDALTASREAIDRVIRAGGA